MTKCNKIIALVLFMAVSIASFPIEALTFGIFVLAVSAIFFGSTYLASALSII